MRAAQQVPCVAYVAYFETAVSGRAHYRACLIFRRISSRSGPYPIRELLDAAMGSADAGISLGGGASLGSVGTSPRWSCTSTQPTTPMTNAITSPTTTRSADCPQARPRDWRSTVLF